MKLKFTKDEDGTIAVNLEEESTVKDFKYVEMIKYLYKKNKLKEPIFSNDISENEQEKIKEMIKKMNQVIVVNDEQSLES